MGRDLGSGYSVDGGYDPEGDVVGVTTNCVEDRPAFYWVRISKGSLTPNNY